ncbi:metallophosphoesterase [Allosphingosinicella sp.]|jgi:hypothetical protein|uniref:metallophosphoesterase n=1 Tax=Allosphingosinicella sp. TaxID=2823234 RepID=UPI002F188ABA
MTVRRALLGLLLLAVAVIGWGYWTAISDPVVRRAEIALPGLESGLRLVLISDIHSAEPDMPAERLERIVAQINSEAARVGPLAIGGLDDDFIHRSDLTATLAKLRRLEGARLLLSHSPDPFADLPADIPLMLAGHTHCGQLRFPLVGAFTYESRYGARFGCGRIDEGGKTLIVSAGLGTSVLPLRLGAVPDLWLIELRSAQARPPRR